ncbi:hypothetical protein IGB42_02599 [Andreprevotia sp. IGB-42]|uniref:DUF1289 domain-containing protein n=1 Tax=Andreprevotia sp. IGB-42 TaxID=2497473 RepID=UPI00135A1719|nr:DUF1289 domain-containing protein [Andreprevotia sp. IGB-42]KAF0812757.1 hypothetical protein IGB42_02599 [Andreprevotia sp. IGB-42]
MPDNRPSSPCVAVCSTALGDDICRGCGRSFFEVANWVMMSEEEKNAVWQRLEAHWQAQGLPPPWLARGR